MPNTVVPSSVASLFATNFSLSFLLASSDDLLNYLQSILMNSGSSNAASSTNTPTYAATDVTPLIAVDDVIQTEAATVVAIDPLANDSYINNSAFSWSSISTPQYGSVSQNIDGTLAYLPEPGFEGTDSFRYTINYQNTPQSLQEVSDRIADLPRLTGDEVSDRLMGTHAAEELLGFGGDDLIAGLLGDDVILGGDGNDVLRGDLNTRSAQTGVSGGDDFISGGAGDDRIGGKSGNDILLGGEGDDQIWGDDGDDIIRGGLGDDTLTGDNNSGGQGRDLFILAAGEGTDTITDFEIGVDTIGLNGLAYEDLTFEGNQIKLGDEVLAILQGVEDASQANFRSDVSTATVTIDVASTDADDTDLPTLAVTQAEGTAVDEIVFTLAVAPGNGEQVSLSFAELPEGITILYNGVDVTAGLEDFEGTGDFTVVVPAGQSIQDRFQVIAYGYNPDGTIQGSVEQSIKVDIAVNTFSTQLNFEARDQNIWQSGDAFQLEWSEYIPFIGGERDQYTLIAVSIDPAYGVIEVDDGCPLESRHCLR